MSTSLVDDYLNPADEPALFTDAQWLDALLRFEAALAAAQADCGLVPAAAAQAIGRACAAVVPDRVRFTALARRTGALGIALVDPLKAWLREHEPEALAWLHWGTTTQDAVDTAHAVLTRDALAALLDELDRLGEALCGLARSHAATPQLARSLMQPAQVTSFGLKCAQAAAALRRSREQLAALAPGALCVQLGGAVGNRAALGGQGAAVERGLALRLGLAVRGHSWHTQRDAWMRLAMEAAVCAGSLAKLARDWSLMAQFEVGEVSEAARGRTSSAMPHKRNPVHCMQAVAQTQPVPGMAAALLGTMAQAHERALGEWQAEVALWAPFWRHVQAAAAAMRHAVEGAQVDAGRMQGHLDALREVVFSEACADALAPAIGKEAAQAAVERLAPEALARQRPLSALLHAWLVEAHGAAAADAVAPALRAAVDPRCAVRASAEACARLLGELEGQDGRMPSLQEETHV